MLIERTIEASLKDRIARTSAARKIIIIYGARQVGKTTLVRKLLDESPGRSEYFNCDYLQVQSMFSWENAESLSQVVKNLDLLVLDEAQRIRDIGMVLKILHDEFPRLQVIATGSSSFELANKVNEPLTGRKIIYHLFPFSYEEVTRHSGIMEKRNILSNVMRFGLYPAVFLGDEKQARESLAEITGSYLFRDIFTLQQLKKPELLLDLLKLLAFQISSEVSYTELAGKLKVDQTVIQRYIQLLEESFILFRLPALHKNLRNEIGKTRKIYFWDLGIRNAIISQFNPSDSRNDHGALWENFCIAERMKWLASHSSGETRSWFWRTYSQKEIDYIEETGTDYKAFEFKWSNPGKVKTPTEFLKAYAGSEFSVVHRENIDSFIGSAEKE
jgi:predicted AAA+ superfamily ATPase